MSLAKYRNEKSKTRSEEGGEGDLAEMIEAWIDVALFRCLAFLVACRAVCIHISYIAEG